jgi:hypothetical protein
MGKKLAPDMPELTTKFATENPKLLGTGCRNITVGPLTLEVPADEAGLILDQHAATLAYKADPTPENFAVLMDVARKLGAVRAPKFA